MVQEIITFIIIGSAIIIAVTKTIKKFSRKKRKRKLNLKTDSSHMEHKCSDCAADCMLRNTINTSVNANHSNLCKKVEIESK